MGPVKPFSSTGKINERPTSIHGWRSLAKTLHAAYATFDSDLIPTQRHFMCCMARIWVAKLWLWPEQIPALASKLPDHWPISDAVCYWLVDHSRKLTKLSKRFALSAMRPANGVRTYRWTWARWNRWKKLHKSLRAKSAISICWYWMQLCLHCPIRKRSMG